MSDVTLRFKINPSPFIRAMHDAGAVFQNMGADMAGKPRPPRRPYPKAHSGLTARQYRASRRAYGRAKRAHQKAMRSWTPDRPRQASALAAFAAALAKSKETA